MMTNVLTGRIKTKMLTVGQVATQMNVTGEFVRNLIRSGKLRAYKLGGWRVLPADLDEYIDAQSNALNKEARHDRL